VGGRGKGGQSKQTEEEKDNLFVEKLKGTPNERKDVYVESTKTFMSCSIVRGGFAVFLGLRKGNPGKGSNLSGSETIPIVE